MTTLRTGEPWVPAPDYGHTLRGLSLNLIVRDVASAAGFLVHAFGLRCLYQDRDFAAFTAPDIRIMLHADHTYDAMPAFGRIPAQGPRGGGAEIRVLGIDPDEAAQRAPLHGGTVLLAPRDFPHGWREAHIADPDGYLWAVGVPLGGAKQLNRDVRLRALRGEDADAILPVIDDWWGGRPMRSHLPRLFFEHFADTSFAAEDSTSGELLGFLCGLQSRTAPEEAYIHFVGVDPTARGRGIGKLLYEAFFAELRARGCRLVRCVTSPVNRGSVAFHRAMGFALLEGDAEEDGLPVHLHREGPGTRHVVFARKI